MTPSEPDRPARRLVCSVCSAPATSEKHTFLRYALDENGMTPLEFTDDTAAPDSENLFVESIRWEPCGHARPAGTVESSSGGEDRLSRIASMVGDVQSVTRMLQEEVEALHLPPGTVTERVELHPVLGGDPDRVAEAFTEIARRMPESHVAVEFPIGSAVFVLGVEYRPAAPGETPSSPEPE